MPGPGKILAMTVVAITTATIGLWIMGAIAQEGPRGASLLENGLPKPNTQTQADAGRSEYAVNCAGCHQNNLSGSGDQPPLAGPNFMSAWGNRSIQDLYNDISTAMPYGNPGILTPQSYQDIVAFILSANGALVNMQAFWTNTNIKISSVATGQVPAAIASGTAVASAMPAAPSGEDMRFGIAHPGNIKNYIPVTDDMLAHQAPGDWLMYRRNYQGWSYSPLNQVTTKNVGTLQLKWAWAMNEGGASEVTPIVHNGIMFLSNTSNTIQALDARSGDLLWENRIGPVSTRAYSATRSLALYGNNVYVATTDAKLYALDARTGKIVWQTIIADASKGFSETGGVMTIHGKVLVGLTICRGQEPHCFISAYDANTGKLDWKFTTIALKGTPGGDTWNNIPDEMRAGGETWVAGTYDPDLNLTYWGTAQSKPWMQASRRTGTAATLYANSTLALDPDTGKLKWYFSHAPGESFDLDEVFERVLIDHGPQKTLMTVGKIGILWKLDRVTGKFLDAKQTVFQNIYTGINMKTGVPTYRPDIVKQKTKEWIAACPSAEGGHNWPSTSYDQPNDLIIIPLSQSCNLMMGQDVPQGTGTVDTAGSERMYFMPGSDGNMGRLSAYETSTMKPVWSFQQRSPFLTGILSTAGDLAFVGDFDRVFRAVDAKTGKTLWTTRLGTTVQGNPVSFSVDGKQYIAVEAGLGGGSPEAKPTSMLPEIRRPDNGQAIYVFALPDSN